MNELDIQLIINPACELIAVDRTSYQNLHYEIGGELQYLRDRSEYVSIEFLTDADQKIVEDSINLEQGLNRSELLDGNTSVFYFPKDGTFTYYKLLVPHLSHLMTKDWETNEDIFKANDQTFFFNGNFYYYQGVDVGLREFPSLNDLYIYFVENSKLLSINDLWKYQGTQTFSFQKMLFSVCKLQKCLVNLQKRNISNPDNCMECGMETPSRFKRDFLLSALYVFDYLKDIKNFDEAQRILDNMSDCNSYLCEDNSTKSDCGCGKVVY